MPSYVVVDRDLAERGQRIASWLAWLLEDAGPSWRRHSRELRRFAGELEREIARSKRIGRERAA